MANLTDLTNKRSEVVSAIENYKTAIAGGDQPTIDAAKTTFITKNNEYGALVWQVQQDNPTLTEDDLYSDPVKLSSSIRENTQKLINYGPNHDIPMIISINTEATTPNETTVNTGFIGGKRLIIDWGDGIVEDHSNQSSPSHTYATPGIYTVKLSGVISTTNSPLINDVNILQDVSQWGNLWISNADFLFYNALGFTITASDGPRFGGGCRLIYAFRECSDFNSDISHWDVSNIEILLGTFANAIAFNQDISNWDVSNVNRFAAMFYGAEAFNQPLNNWNVGKALRFTSMFNGATAFNQPLNNWNISSALRMSHMFANATSFNQDLSGWDTSNVEYMNRVFNGATSFSQDLSGWDVSNVIDHSDFDVNSGLTAQQLPLFP